MKLYQSPTSPYVRKVIITAREAGLEDRITLQRTSASPVRRDENMPDAAPLGKIPVLGLEDGTMLYDSRVICQYLVSLQDGCALLPASGPARFDALRREAAADGLLDAALLARYEVALRPEALRWQDWIDGQLVKVARALDVMEADAARGESAVDLGAIATFCALGYLDFRYSELDWREGRPALAAWYEGFAARPSAAGTAPA